MKQAFFYLAICIIATGFAACGGDDPKPNNGDDKKATAIELSKIELTVEVGKTANLAVKLTPADATGAVTWLSSDAAIASVENGIVTGKKKGTATITAKIDNLTSAPCAVTVIDPASIDVDKLLGGSNYYVFAMDETSFARIQNKVSEDLRMNGAYSADGTIPAEVTSLLEIWGNTLAGGSPLGPNSFGEQATWISLYATQTGDWVGNGCGGLKIVHRTLDLSGVTGDYVLVITYKANSTTASDFVKFSVFSTTGTGEWPTTETLGSTVWSANTQGEWKLLEFPMSTFFDAGVDWSQPFVDGVTLKPDGTLKAFYTLGLLIATQGNYQLDVDAAFVYKPAN
ncbi:MAG: Ig-like domain-containing protein [Prevotellaceae bacterium]|jgi:hypothetical protein|nr:Ig-like domain-containing protein [Prevotellaceae bacterium]